VYLDINIPHYGLWQDGYCLDSSNVDSQKIDLFLDEQYAVTQIEADNSSLYKNEEGLWGYFHESQFYQLTQISEQGTIHAQLSELMVWILLNFLL
jgi:hypothetical protein